MEISIRLDSRHLLSGQLLIISFALALGSFAYAFTGLTGHDSVLGFLPLLDVGNESSITTYLSAVNLLVAAALLFLLYRVRTQQGAPDARCWRFLSPLFLLLSIDESISVHEKFANVYSYLRELGWMPALMDSHQWVPFGVLFVAVIGVIVIPMLRYVNPETVRYMFVAGAIFITGALGFEFLGAVMLESGIVASKTESLYLARRIVEEGLEMYGIAIFNWAIFREIQRVPATVRLGQQRISDRRRLAKSGTPILSTR